MKDKFLKLTNTVYKVLEFFPESDPLKNRAKDKALVIMEHLVLLNENIGWASFQKEKTKSQLLEDIDVLLGYLWIGKSQGWLSSVNCLIIANEYEKIKKDIEPIIELTRSGIPAQQEILDRELPLGGKLSRPDATSQKLPGAEEQPVLQHNAQAEPKDPASRVLDDIGAKKERVPVSSVYPDNAEPVSAQDKAGTSARQGKILEFLTKNGKGQVMDLQAVLPDITKRTVRRDLDELLENGRITRMGDFNQVFYQIKR